MEQGTSKRQRTSSILDVSLAAPLSAHHAAAVERIARELAELAGTAPGVPQLAKCSAQLATLLVQQLGVGAMVAVAATVAPFDSLPGGVVEIVLLHCDAWSLGRMNCASRFFGGGQQRSLVERVASSPARLRAVLTPALRPHEVASRMLQLWKQENPLALSVDLLRQLAEVYGRAPGWRDEALQLYRRALQAEPDDYETLFQAAGVLRRKPSGIKEFGALCRRMLVLQPDNTNVLFHLAELLGVEPSGREEAEALYRRALVVDPDDTSVLVN